MNNLFAYIASHAVAAREALRREEGQGALEYIAIVVGLILLIAAGFAIAGRNVFDAASNFVKDVIGEAGG